MAQIASTYGLHATSVQDCLEPEHLPKYERFADVVFFILRSYDQNATPAADTVQELTRKVAVFMSERFLITIHRHDQAHIADVRAKWCKQPGGNSARILHDILYSVFQSFEKPIDNCLLQLESCEMRIFGAVKSQFSLQEGYYLRRKAFVFKRIVKLSLDLLPKISATDLTSAPYYQDLKDLADHLLFYADDLLEGANALLNLHISISSHKTNEASHRTNEVMRVLTLFSVFFLPLSFVASIYGMNFKFMPELELQYGYFGALGIMVLISLTLLTWFWRKGWLR